MSHGSASPSSKAKERTLLAPHRVALILLWMAATGALTLMLFQGVRHTGQYSAARLWLQAGYVAALLWYLSCTGTAGIRPEPQTTPRRNYWTWLPVLGIVILFLLTAVSDDGFDILLLLLIVATAWILLAWRRDIRIRAVVQGVGLALIAYLAGRPAVAGGLLGETPAILLPALAAPMYVAGGLLFSRTQLGGIRLLEARYRVALKSMLYGCLLFVPLGLFNAADGSPALDIAWVTDWWMPLALPWFSGIAEEIWFRLLLVGLCFFLLRPAFEPRPAVAVVVAVLLCGIMFGLGHGRTFDRFLTTGLLYGVPMAAIFASRDWEHAVGSHYMVNMIPWLVVFLEN